MNEFVTESSSNYPNLSELSLGEIITAINQEDQTVALAVQESLPQIINLTEQVVEKLKNGGRLFYIGAGTSGRLGILDASECPPTYGVPFDMVVGLIAGGDTAIRKAVEFAEDNTEQAIKDLEKFNINQHDFVVGLSASGKTPYVLGGLKKCKEKNILTGCIVCNSGSIISQNCDYPIEVVVGPEIVNGSTRMKSGTAQKLVLNMISTSAMVKLGKVKGSLMVDMQLSNHKLIDRGTKMVMLQTQLNENKAKEILLKTGSVRKAVEFFEENLK